MKSGLILTFLIEIYANMQFYMLFSYSKMSEFDPFGGGSAIFKNVWSSKKSELSEGPSLIENFS